jgi:hypothetical protein
MSNAAEFFDRKVVAREITSDGFEELKLECGHEITLIIPEEVKLLMHPCAQCINEHVEQRRAKQNPNRGGCS